MKKILIENDIGCNYYTGETPPTTSDSVKAQLESVAAGEDIEIEINSPGGSVYDGAVIFNLIRDAAKTHSISVRINCIALSIASYIALACRTVDANAKIIVTDNSVFMIHNPWTFSVGDYDQLRKDADYLEKLSLMLSKVYSLVSGRSESDILKDMERETWYVGKEIKDAGFANVFEEMKLSKDSGTPNEGVSRESAIISARAQFQKMNAKNSAALAECKKIAALATEFENKSQTRSQTKGVSMKPEELLAQDKDCYNAVVALERARVSALLERGKKCGAQDIALKHILDGKAASDNDVVDEFIAAATDKKREEDRISDNVPPVNASAEQSFDTDEQAKAFAMGLKGGMYK